MKTIKIFSLLLLFLSLLVCACSDDTTSLGDANAGFFQLTENTDWNYSGTRYFLTYFNGIISPNWTDTIYYDDIKYQFRDPDELSLCEKDLVVKKLVSYIIHQDGMLEEVYAERGCLEQTNQDVMLSGYWYGPLMRECDSSCLYDSRLYFKYPLEVDDRWTFVDDSVNGRIDKKYAGIEQIAIDSIEYSCVKLQLLYDRDRDGVFEDTESGYEYFSSYGLVKKTWERTRNYIDTLYEEEIDVVEHITDYYTIAR